MNSKKAITLLVLATLLLTMIPVSISRADINEFDDIYTLDDGKPDVAKYTGVYGDTLAVVGEGVTAGKYVNVYWDAVDDWDGYSGYLNRSKAASDGSYEVWFDVPEALNGDHYIWLEDAQTLQTFKVPDAFVVGAYVECDPDSGLENDVITLYGYGWGDEVEIPTITITNITALGLPVGISFEDLSTTPGTPETDDKGSWEATYKVPKVDDDYLYGDYNITCTDDDANEANATLTIGPSVTLNKNEGETGTVVRATGRGFADNGNIATIRMDGIDCVETDDDDLGISGKGEFVVDIVIPAVSDVDEFEIVFTDNLGNHAGADFDVLGLPGVETNPEYGIQGSTVHIMGYNYTQINDEEVEVWITAEGDDYDDGSKVGTFDTDSDGIFEGNFKIPGLASGTYDLWAVQEDWNIDNAEDIGSFKIGLMIVILSPDSGPSGTLVSMTASGFEPDEEWNATLGDEVISDGDDVENDGSINTEFWIPSMEPGVYQFDVLDIFNDIIVSAEFEVTDKTFVKTTPLVAPNSKDTSDYNVTIEGWFFAQDPEDESISFVMYNETEDIELDVTWGGNDVELEADEDWDDGYFKGYFAVPLSDELSIGIYTINVTDGEGMFAQYSFEIVDGTVEINPRKSVFRVGETVSFSIDSSFSQPDSYIKIWYPSGELAWKTDLFVADDWIEVGTLMRLPYFSQLANGNPMMLLDDAPLGTYSWSWYDNEDEEVDEGTFQVEAAAADLIGEQVADLNNQITDLADQLTDVTSDFDDVKSDIADVAAIAQQAVTAANQAAEAVQTVAQTANTASQAASDAAEAANAARDAANGLTTLVYGAIGAALVAALAAIVSLMQISRRIAG
jgi:hypothetical protein